MDSAGRHHPSQKDRCGGGISRTPAVSSPGWARHPRGDRDQVLVWAPPGDPCNPCLGLLFAGRGGGNYPRGGPAGAPLPDS